MGIAMNRVCQRVPCQKENYNDARRKRMIWIAVNLVVKVLAPGRVHALGGRGEGCGRAAMTTTNQNAAVEGGWQIIWARDKAGRVSAVVDHLARAHRALKHEDCAPPGGGGGGGCGRGSLQA